MNSTFKTVLKFIVFLALGVLIFMILYWNFESAYLEECRLKGIPSSQCSLMDKLITDFKSVKVGWILIVILIYMFSNISRALRWQQLITPIGYQTKFLNRLGTIMIGYFTNLALPRVGEFVRAASFSKYEDIPFEKTMGTIVVDRLLDFVGLFTTIALAMVLSFGTFKDYFDKNFEAPSSTFTYLAIGFVLLGIASLFIFNNIFSSKTFESGILHKVQKLYTGFRDGILSLTKVKNFPLLLFHTFVIWLCYYLMTYLCFDAFAPVAHLGPVVGLVVFVFGTLGMVFPSPGGMGSYHFMISSALILFGIDETDAFSFSNIMFFAVTIFGNILFGLIFFVALPLINKEAKTRES